MSKDLSQIYQGLLTPGGLFNENSPHDILYSKGSSVGRFNNESMMETFSTSKEIVEEKQKMEELQQTTGANPRPIEEVVHFKRYSQRRVHKYTEQEMEEIRQSCTSTIVHDYGEYDIYHQSDEIRHDNDVLADISMKLGTLKRTYRQVDKYIEAMRIVVEAWNILAKSNYLHSPDEFFDLVAKGKIVSSQIIMPKLKRADTYNMDMIIKYISNPELDASDLAPKKEEFHDAWYDQFDDAYGEEYESMDDRMHRLLNDEEVQYILDYADNPPEMEVKMIKPKYVKGYNRRNFMMNKKKKKKLTKQEKYDMEQLHTMLNKIQSNPDNTTLGGSGFYSYTVTHGMFEQDDPIKKRNPWDEMRYTGSWTDKAGLKLYEIALREELLKTRPEDDRRYITYADQELSDFFTTLEKEGINTVDLRRKMNATVDDSRRAENNRTKKENRKLEKSIIQRITQLNNDPKFKKLVTKAENAINKYQNGE